MRQILSRYDIHLLYEHGNTRGLCPAAEILKASCVGWLHTNPTEKLRGWTWLTHFFSNLKVISSWPRASVNGEVVQVGFYSCFLYPDREIRREGQTLCWSRAEFLPQNPQICNYVLSWRKSLSLRGSQERLTVGQGFLTRLHFQSWEYLNFPSALPVQTILSLLTAISQVHLQVQKYVCHLKFRLMLLDASELWECLPGTEGISSFFLSITLVSKCSDIPILGFFTFILGMGKKEEEGTECNKTRQWEETDALTTHRLRPLGR